MRIALLRLRICLPLLLMALGQMASLGLSASSAQGVVDDGLKPGEFIWMPQLAPSGPLAIVVSLPAQRAYVYRNAVRIGVSTVSTGKPGFDTPSGVYTILQKHREHYSNLYDEAPMPFMQRLTWDGVALHAGGVPGYPASHGCVRLPAAFAELLFAITRPGTIVVIAAEGAAPPFVASPGLFSPIDAVTGSPATGPSSDVRSQWFPERSPDGPLAILLSTRDKRMVVLRNAVEIGRSELAVKGQPIQGTQAFVLLEGTLPQASLMVPDRPALNWMSLPLPGQTSSPGLREAVQSGQLSISPDFARRVYDVLRPGTTVIVTDEALEPGAADVTVLSSGPPAD